MEGRASEEDVVGESDEKAEGDIGGLTLLDIVADCGRSDVWTGGPIGFGSERSSTGLVEVIAGFE